VGVISLGLKTTTKAITFVAMIYAWVPPGYYMHVVARLLLLTHGSGSEIVDVQQTVEEFIGRTKREQDQLENNNNSGH
jgi:hypothetical protein